jgi:hypothetical protein
MCSTFTVLIMIGALLATSSCTGPAPDEPSAPETPLPEPTSPANVLLALEQLYEDNSLSPSQRASEYANLLVPLERREITSFRFMYGYCDIECPWQEWGFIEEVAFHRRMFSRDRRVLLDLNAPPDFDATYIMPDWVGWRAIHTDSVRMSVWVGDRDNDSVHSLGATLLLRTRRWSLVPRRMVGATLWKHVGIL